MTLHLPRPQPDTGISDAARARLADGIEIYMKGASQHDGWNGAEWISLALDTALLERLLALRALCAAQALTMVQFAQAPLSSQHPDRQMSSWSVRLNGNCFWLYGVPSTEDDLSISCTVNFETLLRMLAKPDLAAARIDGFGTIAGALLVADDHYGVDELLETLEVDAPGLLAREREMQMAASISKHVATAGGALASEAAPAPAPRRRPGV